MSIHDCQSIQRILSSEQEKSYKDVDLQKNGVHEMILKENDGIQNLEVQ